MHGGLLTVELPADQHGLRPRRIVEYTTATARRYTAPGVLTDSDPITVVQNVRQCRDLEYCPGQTREQLTTIGYSSGTAARNLQPTHTITSLGNNTLVAQTDYTYNHLGNVVSVDGPLAGSDDTTTYRYDDAGQLVGTITADPDGTGSQKRFATRLTYNNDGQVTTREQGRVDGLTEADWNAFAPDYKFISEYDEFGRMVKSAQVHPTSIHQYSATQYSYDLAGRVTCTAQRMTAGSHGEDRISRQYYDTADRVIQVRNAVGTPLEQVTAAFEYSANGVTTAVTDAKNNRTLYALDGHDRSTTIYYPDPSTPNQHNPSDKEVAAYDANGNITAWENRAGETFTFTYDNLNRVITKVVPERTGLDPTHTRDIYYDYDLLGQLTDARFDSLTGEGLTFTYNSRGQLLKAETTMDGVLRKVQYGYDELNRRTRITYPDSRWFTYENDVLNRFTKLYRYATAALVTNIYRPTGQPGVSATGGTALNTSRLYDAAGRNTTHKLTSGTNPYNVTNTFTYNPAYQVVTETPDNPLYEWDQSINSQVTYAANGLNQYTSVDGTAYSYDANGNLTNDGNGTFVYDPENRLVTTSGQNNATLRYDPFGRLYEVTDDNTGDKRRLVYDGDALIAEYAPDGTMLDRCLHGPSGLDDPLIWYPDSSISSNQEHYLHADRLGSIVAISKRDGTITGINSYDEYGMPGQNPIGRFRYTGQAWVPEAGLYYYKARMYSPSLGRFMQTDPIGYADGMNIYRYAGNDPVNGIDPTGMSRSVMAHSCCPTAFGYLRAVSPGSTAMMEAQLNERSEDNMACRGRTRLAVSAIRARHGCQRQGCITTRPGCTRLR